MEVKQRHVVFVSVPSNGVFNERMANPYPVWDINPLLLRRLAELHIRYPHHAFVSPSIQNYAFVNYLDGVEPKYEDWRVRCETIMSVCTAVIVMTFTGWRNSFGVNEEIRFANELCLPIRYLNPETGELTDLPAN